MRTRILLLGLLVLTAGAIPEARGVPAAPRPLLVRAARAILDDGTELAPAEILVEGGWIAAVGEHVDAPEGTEVLDAGDGTIFPGLVDAHAWLDRARELAEPARPSTPAFRSVDAGRPSDAALAAERRSGVTAICLAPNDANVVGGRPALFAGDGAVIREELGLKLAVGGDVLAPGRYPASQWGALDLLRSDPAVRAAEQARTPLLIRADSSADLAAALAFLRERPEARAALVGAGAARDRVAEIAKAGAAVIWGPASLGATDRELALPAAFAAAGVEIAFATDARPGTLRRTAVLAHRAGLPRAATLRALTAGAADAIGAGDTVGRLAKGARADLVVFAGDPLDLSARVTHVLIGGRVVDAEGEEGE